LRDLVRATIVVVVHHFWRACITASSRRFDPQGTEPDFDLDAAGMMSPNQRVLSALSVPLWSPSQSTNWAGNNKV
jgi:hypothetical protein